MGTVQLVGTTPMCTRDRPTDVLCTVEEARDESTGIPKKSPPLLEKRMSSSKKRRRTADIGRSRGIRNSRNICTRERIEKLSDGMRPHLFRIADFGG